LQMSWVQAYLAVRRPMASPVSETRGTEITDTHANCRRNHNDGTVGTVCEWSFRYYTANTANPTPVDN
jgi:hypothetical protein